jgi:hypothetical protein
VDTKVESMLKILEKFMQYPETIWKVGSGKKKIIPDLQQWKRV